MKNPLLLCLSFLLGLTLLTSTISYFELIPNRFGPIVYLGIALGKFILVAFEFMELRKAHLFYSVSTLILGLVLVICIAIFTFR
jgi:hypothetical protein